MTFTVSYRGADGTIREERVEAANRTECIVQCRARGITPISVKEGWNGRGEADRSHGREVKGGSKAPSVVSRALLVAAALVVLAGGGHSPI